MKFAIINSLYSSQFEANANNDEDDGLMLASLRFKLN